MKLQSLAIIFIIIIMPISMVLSEYVSNEIKTEERELSYNTKLLNSTYDAIKAYQLNTVNNAFGDVTNKKIEDIEAAAKVFYDSLATNFNFMGNKSGVMKEYVPAVVFTMYDGYYTYSPFKNTLTEVKEKDDDGDDAYDKSYSVNGELEEGLKPYVYYTCRYKDKDENASTIKNDFSIIYTLDNYITIQGIVNGEFVYDNGYLYSIATSSSDTQNGNRLSKVTRNGKDYYSYMGVEFSEDDTEKLKENVGSGEFSYAKINGKKYYLDDDYYTSRGNELTTKDGITFHKSAGIFYIDSNGTRNYSQTKGYSDNDNTKEENKEFLQYLKAIKSNKSAYEYYKNAYEFSYAVLKGGTPRIDKAGAEHKKGYNLKGLSTDNATIWSDVSQGSNMTPLTEYGAFNIFSDDGTNIENDDSNFNKHRKSIIRYVVETNLSSAIESYSSTSDKKFLMPKISETDWETIENDVCAISFLQGMSLGAKKYNGYAVVANTLTKEYIDENDIYIFKNDGTYCKVNDKTIQDENNIKGKDGYYQAAWKVDFEQRQIIETHSNTEKTIYYNPINLLGSYTSIMGSYDRETLEGTDMYKYIMEKNTKLKRTYLKALGRERWGSYNVNNINYELYGNSNGNLYFLNDYEVNL